MAASVVTKPWELSPNIVAALRERGYSVHGVYRIEWLDVALAAWPVGVDGDEAVCQHVYATGKDEAAAADALVDEIARAEKRGMVAQWVEGEAFAPDTPKEHQDAAVRILGQIPAEWTRVEAKPAYTYKTTERGDDLPDKYVGVLFKFYRGGRFAAFSVKDPRFLEQNHPILHRYLDLMRHSFASAQGKVA